MRRIDLNRDELILLFNEEMRKKAAVPEGRGLRRLFTCMYNAYERNFSTPDGVVATYDLLFFQAKN